MAKKLRRSHETDDAYFLKLVLFMILGSMWLKVSDGQSWQVPLPVGLVFGIMLARHDHFRIDRKIEYAVLLIAAFIGFWAPIGIYINL
ncbi:MAG TPA: hypothetical protein PKB09_01585 [Candidatus Saccharibacteria bacterium]|nr:hypothetical protein [Candidatus Saccharibacteria bacterium]